MIDNGSVLHKTLACSMLYRKLLYGIW